MFYIFLFAYDSFAMMAKHVTDFKNDDNEGEK